MNLITDPWIPVRTLSGAKKSIRPAELVDLADPPIELDAVRPDFNGALAQFLIGLLQLAASPNDEEQWREHFRNAPSLDELHSIFQRYSQSFELEGERGFMQDAEVDVRAQPRALATLLLDAPGENAVENNTDLFIKRRESFVLAPEVAAQALYCLQTNAPSGGQGHRTSLRGGGPLSVLLWPAETSGIDATGDRQSTLWQKLWLNVLPSDPEMAPAPAMTLPWTADTIGSDGGRSVFEGFRRALTTEEARVLCYFATPRRVRLITEPATGRRCSLTGAQTDRVVVAWVTRNLGANYPSDKFQHPLSPYYRSKDGKWLPQHTTDAGFSYRDWIDVACAAADSQAGAKMPEVVSYVLARRANALGRANAKSIWVFAYAMDNMKVLAWHEARFPAFNAVTGNLRRDMGVVAAQWVTAANDVVGLLARALRRAWTVQAKGDVSVPTRTFLASTESEFYRLVGILAADEAGGPKLRRQLHEQWRDELRHAAFRIFEAHAERAIDDQSGLSGVKRVAKAHAELRKNLMPAIDKALGLNPTPRKGKEAA